MTDTYRAVLEQMLTFSPSRRVALGGGIAALTLFSRELVGAQEATPGADMDFGPLVVQSFSHGTLFQTQGDSPDLPPYTLILWDATGAGPLFVDRASRTAGIIPTDQVVQTISASSPAIAALVAHPDETESASSGELVWVLEIHMGSEGSDPGAITYLGYVHDDSRAAKAFGIELTAAPTSQNFSPGYLIITSFPGLDLQRAGVLRLTTG